MANLRRVFEHVSSCSQVSRRVFAGHGGLFMSGFGCGGPIYVSFWLGFHGFWAVSVAGKEKVAEVAVTSVLFSRLRLFCAVLARRVANVL